MNKEDMQAVAKRIGILALQKKELEDEIKKLKCQLKPHLKRCKQEENDQGAVFYVLDGVDGFTCKMYDRTQLYAKQAVARKILHANTFNAIFKPSTSVMVDIRPTKETKRKSLDELALELGE